jgi:hypothetical protein
MAGRRPRPRRSRRDDSTSLPRRRSQHMAGVDVVEGAVGEHPRPLRQPEGATASAEPALHVSAGSSASNVRSRRRRPRCERVESWPNAERQHRRGRRLRRSPQPRLPIARCSGRSTVVAHVNVDVGVIDDAGFEPVGGTPQHRGRGVRLVVVAVEEPPVARSSASDPLSTTAEEQASAAGDRAWTGPAARLRRAPGCRVVPARATARASPRAADGCCRRTTACRRDR